MCILSTTIGTTVGAVLGISAAVGAAAIGTVGSIVNSYQNAAIMEAQAEQAKINQQIYDKQSADILDQGENEKRQLALQQAALTGRARSGFGASGAALGSGSLLNWEESNAEINDMDRLQLDYDIKGRSYQAKLGAWNAGRQADIYSSSARSAQAWAVPNGLLSGTASLLNSAGRIGKWSGTLLS